jgi:hypothetical protein
MIGDGEQLAELLRVIIRAFVEKVPAQNIA